MRRDISSGTRLTRTAVVLLTCAMVVAAVAPLAAPVRAQSDAGTADAAADDQRCFPDSGRDLTIGDGNPHLNVTVHTSLFTSPSPPSALGIAARGVAVDADIVELRTGVLLERAPERVSADAVWDSFVILFDYRLSLPMFADSIDDSTYEPAGGPVSGVETRGC
ncbi:hypothetical protein GCM10008995_06470 [Halobellus salinus]|uniref:Uncharacterized protein n=1 Tax=Halobellus salinus TaxID=931585 RepID=A0A830E7D0_9EURY|nr:hypothetical protein [Halobellus salinus]GGI99234.1 hypothetical protein GCM10008995_06470 [Halobellus salinus]SMP04883.1 hypothetical protein SAMN06265347_10229 [Halobellus salinus]